MPAIAAFKGNRLFGTDIHAFASVNKRQRQDNGDCSLQGHCQN